MSKEEVEEFVPLRIIREHSIRYHHRGRSPLCVKLPRGAFPPQNRDAIPRQADVCFVGDPTNTGIVDHEFNRLTVQTVSADYEETRQNQKQYDVCRAKFENCQTLTRVLG